MPNFQFATQYLQLKFCSSNYAIQTMAFKRSCTNITSKILIPNTTIYIIDIKR